MQSALDAIATSSHRTEKLLQLSRAESGATLGHGAVNMAELAAVVVQEFWHSREVQRRLRLVITDEEILPAKGDLDTLAIALRNLVENALKYSAGASVVVSVRAPCSVVVREKGPGSIRRGCTCWRRGMCGSLPMPPVMGSDCPSSARSWRSTTASSC